MSFLEPTPLEQAIRHALALRRQSQHAFFQSATLTSQKPLHPSRVAFGSALYFTLKTNVLRLLREKLWEHRHLFAETIAEEMHKPVHDVLETDVLTAMNVCDGLASQSLQKHLHPSPKWSLKMQLMGRMTWVHRRPLGIVGVITPWNYPLATPMSTIGSAWLCGNQVLFKPSEYTPKTAGLLVKLWHEALQQYGFSPLDVQLLDARRSTGEQVVRHPDIDGFCFTGSSTVGAFIRELAGHRPCVLELGGNDPAILLPSLPLHEVPDAMAHIVWSRFSNAGQTCAATKRLWIPASLKEAVYTALIRHVSQLKVGTPFASETHIGPLVSWSQQQKALEQKHHALQEGAKVLVEASLPSEESHYPFVAPCVLVDVQDTHLPWQEEVFAPILSCRVYPDATLPEVVASEASQGYALGASVWGDEDEALSIAACLPASQVGINETVMPWYAMPSVPWLAFGRSGQGARHAQEGMYSLTRPQALTENWFWSVAQVFRKAPWLFQTLPTSLMATRYASAEALCGSFSWGSIQHPFKLQWLWLLLKRFW
ncbi:MAG: aldehyde dehydrogenase family protein [Vampirovibrionales bacterium]